MFLLIHFLFLSCSWILKTDYLTASSQAEKLLPEEPYEWHKNGLNEDGAISLEAPRKWRLLKQKTGHGAFYGMRIVIYGECIAPSLVFSFIFFLNIFLYSCLNTLSQSYGNCDFEISQASIPSLPFFLYFFGTFKSLLLNNQMLGRWSNWSSYMLVLI